MSMYSPRISIAMATYNGAAYIRRQLDSLGEQTLPPYELVVCDDGSKDETLAIVEDFASRVPFPVLICRNPRRLGYGDNFLHAGELCRGDWVAFCDQDDVWSPRKLARCAEFMPDDDLLLCVHSADLVDEALRPLNRRWPNIASVHERWPNTGNPWSEILPGFAMVLRRSLLDLVPAPERIASHLGDTPAPHDLWVDFLASALGKTIFIPEALALYRQHRAHASGAPGALSVRDKIRKSMLAGAETYGNLARRAKERAHLLSGLATTLPPPLSMNAAVASTRYRRLGGSLLLRRHIYASASPIARMRLVLQALQRGAYGRISTGRLGSKALLKDSSSLLFASPPRKAAGGSKRYEP